MALKVVVWVPGPFGQGVLGSCQFALSAFHAKIRSMLVYLTVLTKTRIEALQ